MILTAHQPAYLPWLGLFHKIALADKFVFLDNLQFEKNSVENRNKIKTSDGAIWLTVPVNAHINLKSNQTKIDFTHNWFEKHLKTISHSVSANSLREVRMCSWIIYQVFH